MVEFTSETRNSSRPVTLVIALAVFAVGIGALFLYVRYQQKTQAPAASGPVVVPGMLRPGDSNFEYYRNKIRIENPRASLGITFSKSRVAFVSFVVANEGDRRLEALELKVTLYDVYDQFSKEALRTPLRPGAGLNAHPMEPLEKRAFTIGVEAIEQLWNPRRLEIEITGLKYQ